MIAKVVSAEIQQHKQSLDQSCHGCDPPSSVLYLSISSLDYPGSLILDLSQGPHSIGVAFFAHLGDLFAIDGSVQNKTFSLLSF